MTDSLDGINIAGRHLAIDMHISRYGSELKQLLNPSPSHDIFDNSQKKSALKRVVDTVEDSFQISNVQDIDKT